MERIPGEETGVGKLVHGRMGEVGRLGGREGVGGIYMRRVRLGPAGVGGGG